MNNNVGNRNKSSQGVPWRIRELMASSCNLLRVNENNTPIQLTGVLEIERKREPTIQIFTMLEDDRLIVKR
jgi:hypothetical protein